MLKRRFPLPSLARLALLLSLSATPLLNVWAGDSGGDEVRIPTSDGGIVFARARGNGAHCVVLVPGGRFTHESWAPQARILARHGYRTLAIDLRGRGDSVAGSEPDGHHLDVLAAIEFLHETGAQSVSVVGASFGGGVAAEAAIAAGPGKVSGLVLLAASSVDAPERIPGRKLFITTRDDFRGEGVPRLPEIREQYQRTPGPKRLVVVDGSAHAQAVFEAGSDKAVINEILAFLDAIRDAHGASGQPSPDATRASPTGMNSANPACPDEPAADAADAIAARFADHPFIFIGSTHGGFKRHEFLLCLLSRPRFQAAVTDILVEFVSGAHQGLLDDYLLTLEPLSHETLRPLALDTDRPELFATLPQVPEFLAVVRTINEQLDLEQRIRVIGGSESIRWNEVDETEDLARFPFKTNWSVHVIVEHLATDAGRRVLIVYGDGGHILHGGTLTGDIEAFVDPEKLFVIGTIRSLEPGEREQVSAFGDPAAPFFVTEDEFPDLSSMTELPEDLYRTHPTELKQKIDALVYLGPTGDRDLIGTDPITADERAELERRRRVKGSRESMLVRLRGRDLWFVDHPADFPPDPRSITTIREMRPDG